MELFTGSYTSCIKIANQPIIPPFMNVERKLEMQHYRALAISLEKRKSQKRQSIDSGVMTSSGEGSVMKKNEVENTHQNNQLPVANCEQIWSEAAKIDTDISESEPTSDSTFRERRNSYTLETPSPVLLAYVQSLQSKSSEDEKKIYELFMHTKDNLDKYNTSCTSSENTTEDCSTSEQEKTPEVKIRSKRKLWDFKSNEKCSPPPYRERKSKSLPSSLYVSPVPLKRSVTSLEYFKPVTDDSYNHKPEQVVKTKHEINSSDNEEDPLNEAKENIFEKSTPEKNHNDSTERSNPSLEKINLNDSFSKDFNLLDTSIQNESKESDMGRESTISDCSSVSLNKFIPFLDKKSECDEAEYDAFLYLKEQLTLKHRKELARLLQEQQKEHDLLKEQFRSVSRTSTQVSRSSPSSMSTYVHPDAVQMSRSSSSVSTYVHRNAIAISSSPKRYHSEHSKLGESHIYSQTTDEKKTKAATVINAAARGYLTRRLFRTERVVLLVQTIKDCLITAVSLQSEPNLGLSELDLQNRLLQQLTVACNDLHDIFSLSVKQRMAIITLDREKKNRIFRRSNTPLPLSEATKRTLLRKTTNSAPVGQKKFYRKRCQSAGSASSVSRSCNNTPVYGRPIASTITSQKSTLSQSSRRPWR